MTPQRIAIFWGRVDRTPDCWVWTAGRDAYGYGAFWDEGRVAKAHRIAYELTVGPIPAGLVIDHLCRNHWCVNPAHLEPVTQAENIRRGAAKEARKAQAAAITHCPQRHEYTPANTAVYDGKRHCRACNTERARRARAAA